MRILTAVGALMFGYMTIIPAGLVVAQLDSACMGSGCESSPVLRGILLAAYVTCALILFGTAALMVDYTLRGTHAGQERIVGGLIASGAAIGVTAFALLAAAAPRGGAIVGAVGAATYLALRYYNRQRPQPDASTNGHRSDPPELRL